MEDRFIRCNQVEELTGQSRSTIYRKIANDEFPKPIKTSARASRWRLSEINQWMESLPRL
ncbi:MAG: AlpA family transcriptional regulator [Donghicola eburneus]|jgi:prophage regulatory protein|nr:AlpA family transcriptional regulator [Donghicola eburneus]MCI5042619.1 AlpA family transcriptional regulator [Donghicola eburneus]